MASAWSPRLFAVAASSSPLPAVTRESPPAAKIALYRSLFAGRDDVYAYRWENPDGRKGWAPARTPGWKRSGGQGLLPLTDEVIEKHLLGGMTAGLYPLMHGDSCRLVVCDLDGAGWQLDALAYLEACAVHGVPASLERSRSGDGGHLWTFFDTPVPASSARQLGAALLREAMALRAEIDLSSYDRLFPSQDFMPAGKSFGNLIALPLQGDCRKRGNTLFLDPVTMRPFDDQWVYLSSVERLSAEAVGSLTSTLRSMAVGPDEGYTPTRRTSLSVPAPAVITGVRGAMIGIRRIGVPPPILADLKHLASAHNPEFYKREQQRLWTGGVSRLVRCYREDLEHLWLPRGLEEQVVRVIADAGSRLELDDVLPDPEPIDLGFHGQLTLTQQGACDALADHTLGVLVAPTGAGKTVMACELGSGRKRRSRIVDIALFGSVARRAEDPDTFAGYGLVVIDECHHVPAPSFDAALRHAPIRRWLGLTATPRREDGLQAIMTMHCGPVRKTITRDSGPLVLRAVTHQTLSDPTSTSAPGTKSSSRASSRTLNATTSSSPTSRSHSPTVATAWC